MEDDRKTIVETVARCIATGIVLGAIEDAFTVGYDEEEEGIMTPFRNMVEGASIDIVEQGRPNTSSVCSGDKLDNSICIMDALTR